MIDMQTPFTSKGKCIDFTQLKPSNNVMDLQIAELQNSSHNWEDGIVYI